SFHDIFSCIESPSDFVPSGSKVGQSRRSRAALATSLDPPNLTEGMISSAIQRRAVRIDSPVSRAMSPARRYSLCPVISASPGVGALVWRHARDAAQPIRGRLAEL